MASLLSRLRSQETARIPKAVRRVGEVSSGADSRIPLVFQSSEHLTGKSARPFPTIHRLGRWSLPFRSRELGHLRSSRNAERSEVGRALPWSYQFVGRSRQPSSRQVGRACQVLLRSRSNRLRAIRFSPLRSSVISFEVSKPELPRRVGRPHRNAQARFACVRRSPRPK